MTKSIRYGRPCLELEFDQQALVQPGCCRFVPVVLRLCGIPTAQKVMLTVSFDRVRKQDQQGKPLDDYELHPLKTPFVHKGFPNYEEYAAELLARGHDQETGTIRIAMTSQSGSILSQAEYRLDSRQTKPVQRECKGFLSTRLLTHLRSQEERDALRGQYPAAVTGKGADVREQATPVEQASDLSMAPLFPLE